MQQAQRIQPETPAAEPKPAPKGSPDKRAASSGFEGREEELGTAISMVLKTLSMTQPYPHETNDALIKSHLNTIQFAKNHGMLKELIEHDVKTMSPILARVGKMVQKTGNEEFALAALCERTGCHYQLVLDTKIEPGKRTWVSPYRRVLAASTRVGQHDLTEQEIHEVWVKPRIEAYAKTMGVNIRVSDWNDDGVVTIELAE